MIKGLKKSRKSRFTEDEIAEMIQLKAEGWTYRMLTERFHCSDDTISYYTVPGRKERKIAYQNKRQKELPEKHRIYRNTHRNVYSNRYQKRWRLSKTIKDFDRAKSFKEQKTKSS